MKRLLKVGALFVILGFLVGAIAPRQIVAYCCGAPPPICPAGDPTCPK